MYKISKIIFLTLLFCTSVFGALRDDLPTFFSEDFSPSSDGICEIKCRTLTYSSKYEAKIVDFDGTTGVTSCDVFSKVSIDGEDDKLSIMANFKDVDCEREYSSIKPNYEDSTLASYSNLNNTNNSLVNIDSYDRSILTLSKFVGGLATLDEDVINIGDTISTGAIQRTDGVNVYSPSSATSATGDRLYNSIDKISRENLGYYVDLSYSMDDIYDYIISYIFVFISLFFMGFYFARLLLKKVAKKTTAHDESWQSRLAVVLVAVVVFFIPIKYDSNYSATFFQNTWKFFVDESNSLADRANTVGMETFMKNVYNTTGANGIESEANLKALKQKQSVIIAKYSNLLTDCKKRFPTELTFQETDLEKIKEIEEQNGNGGDDLTYKGCRAVEKRYKVANTANEQLSYMLNRIQSAYTSSTKIRDRLDEINTHINTRVHEMGWYSAVLAPTLKVLVDSAFIQSDGDIPPPVDESEEAKINEATETKIAQAEKDIEGGNWFTDMFTSNSDFQKGIGKVMGFLAYTIVPGFDTIFQFFSTVGTKIVSALLLAVPKVGIVLSLIVLATGKISAFILSVVLVKYLISLVPLVSAFIAGAIAIIMYIYELIILYLIIDND
jgi:hypothetical protein